MWTRSRVRSTWRRNWWPRPAPAWAPSIRPRMSAPTKAGRGVRHQGADRHLQLDIGAVGAMFLVAGAILPPAGLVIAPVAEIDERRQVRIRDHDHAAAAAAVPPVGAAARDVLFAPEADGAVAAVAGLDVDRNLVNKHNR